MKLTITCGCPGSGKTTWAKNRASEDGNTIVISRDDIRETLFGKTYKYTKDKEQMINQMQVAVIKNGFESGKNVIVHDTNCKQSSIDSWRMLAKDLNVDFHIEYFDVNMVILLARNHSRGDKALKVSRLWEFYKNYRELRGWVPASQIACKDKPKCVIFDIDGTLITIGQRSPYDVSKVIDDPANPHIQELFKMYAKAGYHCIAVSGRMEEARKDTIINLFSTGVDINGDRQLFMRKDGDMRPDIEVKEEILFDEILKTYYPVLAVDDRDTPVGMWRMNGIPCLQVNYGDF